MKISIEDYINLGVGREGSKNTQIEPKKEISIEDYIALGVGKKGNEDKQIEKIMKDFNIDKLNAEEIHTDLVRSNWEKIYDINTTKRLDINNFKKQNVLGDGNCLYTAFYKALLDALNTMEEGTTRIPIFHKIYEKYNENKINYLNEGHALREFLWENFDYIMEMCLEKTAQVNASLNEILKFGDTVEEMKDKLMKGLTNPQEGWGGRTESLLLACIFDINLVLYTDGFDTAGNPVGSWSENIESYYLMVTTSKKPIIYLYYDGINHYEWLKQTSGWEGWKKVRWQSGDREDPRLPQ